MSRPQSKSGRPVGPRGCVGHNRAGELCGNPAIAGTQNCRSHPGKPLAKLKAEGAIVTEVRAWGLDDEHVEPAEVMLRLTTQAYWRAALYGELLRQAYEAAETLRRHHEAGALLTVDEDTLGGDGEDDDYAEPPSIQAARDTLDRIFTTGGVGALIGAKYTSTPAGHVFATDEAIRGLVQLEADERDRAFRFAEKCRAAKVDERLIDLAEAQASLVFDVLKAVLVDLGHQLTEERVQRVLAERLTPLSIGAVA